MLAAFESATVLRLDAQVEAPTVGLTTTTREVDFDMASLRVAERSLWQWLRRHVAPVQYVGFLEWTTGAHTPGRRPHIHHLVKGLERDQAAELEPEISRRWADYTGGSWRVECRGLRTQAGAIAYLALHHHKREQAPPPGWTGKRLRPSKGYFCRPVQELREEARELLASRQLEAAVRQALELVADDQAELDVDALLTGALEVARAERAAHPPQLVSVLERRLVDPQTGQITYEVEEVRHAWGPRQRPDRADAPAL